VVIHANASLTVGALSLRFHGSIRAQHVSAVARSPQATSFTVIVTLEGDAVQLSGLFECTPNPEPKHLTTNLKDPIQVGDL
jgi:hypothetical protein